MPIENRGGHCVEQISWRQFGVLAFFTEDVPRRPGVSVVTIIGANDEKDTADVMREVGPPSLTDGRRPWIVALWCFGFTCRNMERTVENSKSPPTLLIHQGSGFTLNDAIARSEREDTIGRVVHAHGIILEP